MKLFYQLKREWRLRINGLKKRLEVWRERWSRRTCPHLFQAAIVNRQPAQVCKLCDKIVLLSREEYYSIYGEKGWRFYQD